MVIQNLVDRLAPYPMVEILVGLAVLLVLIDYFFPTDFPAHLGYLSFSAAVFFMLPLPATASLLIALAVWLVMAVLHQFWWGKYLANVADPKEDDPEMGAVGNDPEQAKP